MVDKSKMLAGRKIQPGSSKFGTPAHEHFSKAVLDAFPEAQLVEEPRFFKNEGFWAMVPDYCLVVENKALFFELKRQGPRGNAHERLYKAFTQKKVNTITERFGVETYPLFGILCDSLATDQRYIREFEQNLEPENYFLWRDYDTKALVEYLEDLIDAGHGIDLEKNDKS